MNDDIVLFDINPEKEEQELVSYLEYLTDKKLSPAQSERVMISVISHQSSLNLIKTNEAFKMMFLRYAKGIFLDLIGEFMGCPRLQAVKGFDRVLFKTYEAYPVDKVIPKGSKIETKDGAYIVLTKEDLIISAGETEGIVSVETELAGELLNSYKAGDINVLRENYEFIESVVNLDGISGAGDEETDDNYRERLYLAPEKLSTAGTRDGYRYYAMSAHKDITDVSVECPQIPASVTIGDNVYTESSGKITAPNIIDAEVDYKTGTLTMSFASLVSALTVKIPPAATIEVCVLTKDGEASDGILQAVDNNLNADNKRPLTDNVIVFSAEKTVFTFDADITLTKEADHDTVYPLIITALNNYFSSLEKKLKLSVIISHIITLIKNIEGVYDIDVKKPKSSLMGDRKKFYKGQIGTLNIKRAA